MLVDAKKQGQLKITLSAVEICDWFGSFSEIRYDSKKTKEALGGILLTAMSTSDFKLSAGKLYIKVYPTDTGGCVIFFTLGTKKRLHRSDRYYIYEFPCCEDMLLACEQIKRIARHDMPLSIYTSGGCYRLLIDGKDICRAILRILPEYASGVLTAACEKEKTREYWQTVCTNTPVSKIII